MQESKKVLMIIDANGQYDKEKGEHITMKSAKVDDLFYETIVNEIRSGEYSRVLYNMNLPHCTTSQEIDQAFKSDPILKRLTEKEKRIVFVFKGGYNLSDEFNDYKKLIASENYFAEKGYEFVFSGLYYDWCVRVHAENLKHRYPNAKISRPFNLSKWSSDIAMKAKKEAVKIWIKENMHKPIAEIMKTLKKKLVGHYNHYGIDGNFKYIQKFYEYVRQRVFKTLNKRTQKHKMKWWQFNRIWEGFEIPQPKLRVSIYASRCV